MCNNLESTLEFPSIRKQLAKNIHLFARSVCLVIFVILTGCGPGKSKSDESTNRQKDAAQSSGNCFFKEVTESAGIDFVHSVGDPKRYFFPDIMVAGCGVIDFDRDGLMDLVLIDSGNFELNRRIQSSGKGNRSYRLFRQASPGKFDDVTQQTNLVGQAYGCGVAVADVNNDGFDDLYFTSFGEDQLFINQEGKSFLNVTKQAGISNPSWSTSATFFDYDRDGRLDLFVANYVSYLSDINCANAADAEDFCSPSVFEPTIDRLFRNVSEGGKIRFKDVTSETGIIHRKGPGLGVISRDFNQDGFPDLYVANDGKANFLWLNQNGKSFEEQANQLGCAMSLQGEAQAGMGIAEADLDQNSVADIVVTHLDGETNAAYLGTIVDSAESKKKQLFYTESGGAKGVQKISKPMTGFGIGLPDLDNDGDQDMLTVNGRVTRRKRELAPEFWSDYAERNQISLNQGQGKFVEWLSDADPFTNDVSVSRGLAIIDFNNDGKLDCLVSNTAGRAHLYENVFADSGNWVGFELREPEKGKRISIGAEIRIRLPDTKSQFSRTIQTDGSYLSANDPRAHFGLGEADSLDWVQVTWPDQSMESFKIGDINRYHIIEKGTGTPVD